MRKAKVVLMCQLVLYGLPRLQRPPLEPTSPWIPPNPSGPPIPPALPPNGMEVFLALLLSVPMGRSERRSSGLAAKRRSCSVGEGAELDIGEVESADTGGTGDSSSVHIILDAVH